MKINNSAIYFMLAFILIAALIIVFVEPRDSTHCDEHKELFFHEIKSGIITEKFIDYDNHALKIVVLKANNRSYKMLFVPYDNWNDFERIRVGDTISKSLKSFHFTINKDYVFQLKYDCPYSKTDSLKN